MPLKITLRANERLFINGASIRNGDKNTDLVIENQSRFLREREVLREADADTAAKRILVTLQALYLSEPEMRAPFHAALLEQSRAIMEAAPSTGPLVAAIAEMIAADQHHRAIKHGRELVALEADLLRSVRRCA